MCKDIHLNTCTNPCRASYAAGIARKTLLSVEREKQLSGGRYAYFGTHQTFGEATLVVDSIKKESRTTFSKEALAAFTMAK